MTPQDLLAFAQNNWMTIAITTAIVTPVVWGTLHFLFKHQIANLQAEKSVLEKHNGVLKTETDRKTKEAESSRQETETLKQKIDVLVNENKAMAADLVDRNQIIESFQRNNPSSQSKEIEISVRIADWTRLAFEVQSKYRTAMIDKKPWPGVSAPLVERENELYTRILAGLDQSQLAQSQLADGLRTLRELESPADWFRQRDVVMALTGAAFKARHT